MYSADKRACVTEPRPLLWTVAGGGSEAGLVCTLRQAVDLRGYLWRLLSLSADVSSRSGIWADGEASRLK